MSIRLGILLFASMPASSESQQVDAAQIRELSGAATMTLSLQLMRDTCSQIYPSQASVIRGLYEASTVPSYARLFQLAATSPQAIDREAELTALGMSEAEASSWCLADFPSMLDEFDEHYANRTEEMK